MKDKNRIINEMILSAADVMEAKIDYNETVAEYMTEKGGEHNLETARRLRAINERTKAAIEVMRENGGCWA